MNYQLTGTIFQTRGTNPLKLLVEAAGFEPASKIRLYTTSTLIVTYYYCFIGTIPRVTRIIIRLNLLIARWAIKRYPYLGQAPLVYALSN